MSDKETGRKSSDSLMSSTDKAEGELLGMPYDLRGLTSPGVRLRIFEPENPSLFVPRTMGLGWDLNLGAVAVKLGLIRPDDSLPDLDEYISQSATRVLLTLPAIGAVANIAAAAVASRKYQNLVSHWSADLKPDAFTKSSKAVRTQVVLSVAAAGWVYLNAYKDRNNADKAEIDATSCAQAMGLQVMGLLMTAASVKSTKFPLRRSGIVPLAVASLPVVTGGILVGTVKSALKNLQQTLANQNASESDVK